MENLRGEERTREGYYNWLVTSGEWLANAKPIESNLESVEVRQRSREARRRSFEATARMIIRGVAKRRRALPAAGRRRTPKRQKQILHTACKTQSGALRNGRTSGMTA